MGGAGICHSDLHIMHEWSPETMPVLAHIEPDFTLGHENAGWIEDVGAGVDGWEKGQAVIVSPVWSCRRCAACRAGDDAYCEREHNASGGLGLVGGLGHMAVAYLKELTGGKVIAADRSESARRLATDLGADLVLPSDETTVDAVRDATKGLGVRAVFDFVGVDATMQLATSVVRQRGKVTVVGLGGGTFPFRYGALPHAATIGFTFGGSIADLAEVVALAENGRVRPHVQHFSFDQIEQAYQALHDGKVEGRAVISPE